MDYFVLLLTEFYYVYIFSVAWLIKMEKDMVKYTAKNIEPKSNKPYTEGCARGKREGFKVKNV